MTAAMIENDELGLGYRIEDEDHEELNRFSSPVGVMAAFAPPKSIDTRPWLPAISQLNMGSCVGHGCRNLAIYLNWLKNKGQVQDFSRMFFYLMAQFHSGFLGADQGAAVAGAIAAFKAEGCCHEDHFPYPVDKNGRAVYPKGITKANYHSYIPAAAFQEAKPHVINSSTVLSSYEADFQYLAAGLGGIIIGTNWSEGMANNRDGLETRANTGGKNLGGHCRCITGYSERKDRSGRNWLLCINSHGRGYGKNGYTEMEPDYVKYLHDCKATFIGGSDMVSYGKEARAIPIRQWA